MSGGITIDRRAHGRRLRGAAVAGVVALGMLGASPAWAAPSTQVVQGQYLRIVSVADWQAAENLYPGQTLPWDLTVSADAPEPGTMTLSLSATGGTPLTVDVLLCAQEWGPAGCTGGTSVLQAAWEVPRDGVLTALTELADTDVAHLRLNVALTSGAVVGATPTELRLHAVGMGETVVIGPDDPLPPTGLPEQIPLALAGAATVLLFSGLLMLLRRRRAESAEAVDAAGSSGSAGSTS